MTDKYLKDYADSADRTARFLASLSDGSTKNVPASNILNMILPQTPYAHNSVPVFEDVTDKITDGTISKHIADGTFDGIFPGQFFFKTVTISGTSYLTTHIFVELDPFYAYNSYALVAEHHIGVIALGLPSARMNATNTTEGGFKGSEMWTTTLPLYEAAIEAQIGSDHIVSHQVLISNAIGANLTNAYGSAGGAASSWGWETVKLMLPGQNQFLDGNGFSSSCFDLGEACKKFVLFNYKRWNAVIGNIWIWFKDVACSTDFCDGDNNGGAHCNGASAVGGVVPYYLYK